MRLWYVLLIVATAISILIPPGAALAQSRDAEIVRQAEALLEQTTAADGPGAAMLVARGDDVLFRRARGLADIELGVPLAPDQTFRIASVTKIFTAATVLKLAEQGRLSLDDPLARHLPDFPGADGFTIRQLLNHTAGVSDIVSDLQPGFLRRDLTTDVVVAEIAKRPPAFAPGARMAYSNAGYILLGAVIEKVEGKPWHVVLDERLLQPLGLTGTRYGTDGPIVPGRVSGYTTGQDRTVRNAGYINASGPAAAGALSSTVDDLHRWMRALATGEAIGADGFQQMSTPPTLPDGTTSGYGFGVYDWRLRGLAMIGHTGQIDGFATMAAYIPEHDITIVVLANNDGFNARMIGRQLAAIAIGQPYVPLIGRPLTGDAARILPGVYGADAAQRTLSVRDGLLYSQRPRRDPIPIQISSEGRLHFNPDELSYFVPVLDERGLVAALDYFADGEGPPQRLPRVQQPGS